MVSAVKYFRQLMEEGEYISARLLADVMTEKETRRELVGFVSRTREQDPEYVRELVFMFKESEWGRRLYESL